MKNEKKYLCIKDLQGGDFAVGCLESSEGWRKIALNWCGSDDNDELYRTVEELQEKEIINFIMEIWQIEIIELSEQALQTINFIEKIYKKIKECENTNNALDYIKELSNYLNTTYMV